MQTYHAICGLSTANGDTFLEQFHVRQDLQQLGKESKIKLTETKHLL